MKAIRFAVLCLFVCLFSAEAFAQTGSIKGTISLKSRNMGLHNASVRLVQLGRVTDTGEDGTFEFQDVPAGMYDLVATMPAMDGAIQSVNVQAGQTATVDFQLSLAGIRTEVTVTASGQEQLTIEAFQTVTSLDAIELAQKPATSLGEVLDGQPGISQRGSGPGSARPVVRGFDGDRVLVLQDGADRKRHV